MDNSQLDKKGQLALLPKDQKPLLLAKDLVIGYKSSGDLRRQVAGPFALEMHAGQLICLLGPNGCGKSTLLRTIAGLQPVLKGEIELDGKILSDLQPAHIAKIISLVLTDNVRSGNLDVYTLIALGRYPHTGWLGIMSKKDREIIDLAISSTHTESFLERKLDSLSDGECQKVMLARALAQDTPLIILDEPTAHLDLPSRIQLMRLLHKLAKEMNKAILISTHELDLALQAADQIWLMSDGHLTTGLPEELVLNGAFQKAFDKDGILFDTATGTFNLYHGGASKNEITLVGDSTAAFWTKRALIRKGFRITTEQTNLMITITMWNDTLEWTLNTNGNTVSYSQLADVLIALS